MTIRQRLYISFSLILAIMIFIIGVFFYATYNLNEIHKVQSHRYDQIRRVEKLKEFNNSVSWMMLKIINDYKNSKEIDSNFTKAKQLFIQLNLQKQEIIKYAESQKEKESLQSIFSNFIVIEDLIKNDLYNNIIQYEKNDFFAFNKKFEKLRTQIDALLVQEVKYLQKNLNNTEKDKNDFIDTIKLELVVLLFIAFLLSFIISSKIIKEIQQMLDKLNNGILQLFNNDENKIQVDIGKNNELSKITDNLNLYLEQQRDIIHSREELLRNISHELKTPITKGKFLIEKIKDNKEHHTIQNINNVFADIEALTSKLLQREKLNFATLNITRFKASSLILESLSKLSIDDESNVVVEIIDDFDIQADKYYLTIALKNLIDNAMKYAQSYPIYIKAKNNKLYVENIAKQLSNDLIYYIQPFTREPNQQMGHGLGLNIVNKIIELHGFVFKYKYNDGCNIFYIDCFKTT